MNSYSVLAESHVVQELLCLIDHHELFRRDFLSVDKAGGKACIRRLAPGRKLHLS